MAGRHFLSVLGTGNYKKAKYLCEEESVTTAYVQEAVLMLKMMNQEEPGAADRITIFLTDKAYQLNWLDRDYTEREQQDMREKGETMESVRKTGLRSVLQKRLGDRDDAEVTKRIPIGASEAELWEIFNIIYDEIQEGEELYVDITHSLRNIPIQMLSVIAYARVLKNVKVKGIYYGAFEVGKKNEEGVTEAPVFDLVTFLNILDWSQAANSFIQYGNSDEIKALFDSQKSRDGMLELYQTVNNLSEITQGLETSRGFYDPALKRKTPGVSVMKSYHSYENTYRNMQKKDRKEEASKAQQKQIKPLGKLFDVINDKLKVFDVEDNLHFGYAAVEWAIDNKKTQQGFTALDETMKTYLCCRYGLDESRERHREGICKGACSHISAEIRSGEVNGDDISEAKREEIFRKWEIWWERAWNGENGRRGAKNLAMSAEQELAAGLRCRT